MVLRGVRWGMGCRGAGFERVRVGGGLDNGWGGAGKSIRTSVPEGRPSMKALRFPAIGRFRTLHELVVISEKVVCRLMAEEDLVVVASRRRVGAPIDCTSGKLAADTLKRAIATLSLGQSVVCLSNQSLHYRTHAWIELCEEHGIVQSMSKKESSLGDSTSEGFFDSFKNEFFCYGNWRGWIAGRLSPCPTTVCGTIAKEKSSSRLVDWVRLDTVEIRG